MVSAARRLAGAELSALRALTFTLVLGEHYNTFQRCLTGHLIQGHGDRRSELAASRNQRDSGAATEKRRKQVIEFDGRLDRKQKTRGYAMFIRTNYHDGLAGGNSFQKQKSLEARWQSLPDHEKNDYKRRADYENDEATNRQGADFVGSPVDTAVSWRKTRKQGGI